MTRSSGMTLTVMLTLVAVRGLVVGAVAQAAGSRVYHERKPNMKYVGRWMIGIGVFIAMGLLVVEPGYTEEPTCTLKTIKGRYLFSQHSTILPPAFGVEEPTPATSAGIQLLNGDGTGTVIFTFRIGGATVGEENHVSAATYTVNPNCTGSLTLFQDSDEFEELVTFGLFIAPNGEEIVHIATAPVGVEISDTSWRVSRRLH